MRQNIIWMFFSGLLFCGHFAQATPVINDLQPAVGYVTGGATVQIIGSGFANASAVTFGDVTASFAVNSDSSITATIPSHPADVVPVFVSTKDVTSPASPHSFFVYRGDTTLNDLAQPIPLAKFFCRPASDGLSLQFDATNSVSPIGAIQDYVWDFGDGETLTTQEPYATHRFQTLDSCVITLTVTNSAGISSQPAQLMIPLEVNSLGSIHELRITSPSTTSCNIGELFQYQISTDTSATNFAAQGLPPEISIDPATGVITGAATSVGTFSVVLSAENQAGVDSKPLTIQFLPEVRDPQQECNIDITTTSLPNGTVGVPYSATVGATGDTPICWTVVNLPPGLGFVISLNTTTIEITGTPTAPGTFSVTIEANNDDGMCVATRTFTIVINGVGARIRCLAPTYITERLKDAVAGEPYADTIHVKGGKPPITFAIVSGRLPGGLKLDPFTGTIFGKTDAIGIHRFTVLAKSRCGKSTLRDYRINVILP